MFNEVALAHRIEQSIAWNGQAYTFLRQQENQFHEKSLEPIEIATLKGVFHRGSTGHQKILRSDSGYTISKQAPFILALWEKAKDLQTDDQVVINNHTYKVTGISNLNEMNIVGEISLEVVL